MKEGLIGQLKMQEKFFLNTISCLTEEDSELTVPITAEIMTGEPKMAVISGLVDHTAHHRGELAVYVRLLGKKPQMPYGEM